MPQTCVFLSNTYTTYIDKFLDKSLMFTKAVFISLLINIMLPCSIKVSVSENPGDGDIVICG